MNEYDGFLPLISESYKCNPKRRSTSAARAYVTLQDNVYSAASLKHKPKHSKPDMSLTVSDYSGAQLSAKSEAMKTVSRKAARAIIDRALDSVAIRQAPRAVREAQRKGKVTLDALTLHEDLRIAREHIDVGVYQANKLAKKRAAIGVEKKPINLKDLKEIYYINYLDGVCNFTIKP
eukprot:TRINITY_DN13489_c0_g1_i2.p1 TRINITY_DN13489_c0_g1~~TRINITY_DN13489_c0_g1_i2.p1  ORF type:complete len:177 (-),score=29.35 TRINITY_DN13489_c0_g1_i2:244-774(-)